MKPEFTFSFPIEIKAQEGGTTKIEMKMDSNQTSHTTSYTVDKNEFDKAKARIAALENVLGGFVKICQAQRDNFKTEQYFCVCDVSHEQDCLLNEANAVLGVRSERP